METALPAVNGSTNTVVVVRVRPFGRKEQMTTACAEALNDGRSLIARRDERRGGQYLQSQQATETSYVFDGTFGPATSQRDVYEQTTKPHVATLARGQIPALTVVAFAGNAYHEVRPFNEQSAAGRRLVYVQALVAVAVLLVAMGVHVRSAPFRYRFQNMLEVGLFAADVAVILLCLAYTVLDAFKVFAVEVGRCPACTPTRIP